MPCRSMPRYAPGRRRRLFSRRSSRLRTVARLQSVTTRERSTVDAHEPRVLVRDRDRWTGGTTQLSGGFISIPKSSLRVDGYDCTSHARARRSCGFCRARRRRVSHFHSRTAGSRRATASKFRPRSFVWRGRQSRFLFEISYPVCERQLHADERTAVAARLASSAR